MALCDTCFTMHDRHVRALYRVWAANDYVGDACGRCLSGFLRGNLHRLSRSGLPGHPNSFHVRPLWPQMGE